MQNLEDRMDKAREFAVKAHGDQMYGKFKYSYHLDQVKSELMKLEHSGWDVHEDAYVVAYLHDVLEDTDVTIQEMFEFSSDVRWAVVLLTKVEIDYDLGKYLETIKSCKIAHIVKIADTLCNLQASINSVEPRRVKKYAEQLAKLMEK